MTTRRQRALTAAMIGLLLGAFAPASAARLPLRARAASQIVDGIPTSRVDTLPIGLKVRARIPDYGVRLLSLAPEEPAEPAPAGP